MRDYHLETTFDVHFTTRRFTTGAPFALASGVISAYPDNSVTQLTAGITLTADLDGVTGLNNIRVVATAANGYAAGSNYALVITTGTVDSVSVVGEVVAEFSLEAQSALRPTVALRKLDVSAGGEGGVDWANVGSPTTTVGLSGTTVKTATDVETDTADIQARIPAALVGGRIDANVGAISSDAPAADNAEAFFDGTGYAGTGNVIPTVTTVGTLTTYTGNTPQTGDAFARLGAPAGASVSADVAAVKVDTAAILVDTGTTLDGKIDVIDGIVDSILVDTAEIGAAGAGLTVLATQASVNTIDDFLDTEIAAILADTNELQTDWVNGGRLDLLVDAIKAQTDLIPAAPASTTNITAGTITTVTNLTNAPTSGDLTATMKTSVNAEVLDVLNTDTFAEPAQGAPGATITLAAKIGYLYKFLRNKVTQTSTTLSVFNDDAATVDHKSTVSDDGTTFTRGEIATGP